jgi:hypothetical protein
MLLLLNVNIVVKVIKNIYFAFRCLDSNPNRLQETRPKRTKDTFLWGGDYVSVAFGKNDLSFRVMTDPRGTVDDWKNGDMSWNGPWKVETCIDNSGWTAEMSIAFNELGISLPALNEKWSMDFVTDSFITGQRFRALAIVDDYSRECPQSRSTHPLVAGEL